MRLSLPSSTALLRHLCMALLFCCAAIPAFSKEKESDKPTEFEKIANDPNMTEEKRTEEMRKNILAAQEKAYKNQNDPKKDSKKKKDKDKDKEAFNAVPVIAGGNVIDFSTAGNKRGQITIDLNQKSKGTLIEVGGGTPQKGKGNTAFSKALDSGGNTPFKIGKPGETLKIGGDSNDQGKNGKNGSPKTPATGTLSGTEKSFDLSGKNNPPAIRKESSESLNSTASAGMGSEPISKGSLLQKREALMATLRNKNGDLFNSGSKDDVPEEKDAPKKEADKPTEVAMKKSSEDESGAPTLNDEPTQALTNDAEKLKKLLENRYERGVTSRDKVERDWAFQFAVAAQRSDAIPYMMKEVKDRGFVCVQAAYGLGYFPEAVESTQDVLLGGLDDKEGNLRQACVESLGRLNARGAIKALLKHYPTEKNYRVRTACCDAFAALKAEEALPLLRSTLLANAEDDLVKATAALALAKFGDASGKNFLVSALNSPEPSYQMMGLSGLMQLNIPDRASYLAMALESKFDEVWVMAAQTFQAVGVSTSWSILRQRLQSPAPPMRRRAAIAFGLLGSDEGLPYLVEALHGGSLAERSMATGLIGLLGRKEYTPQLIDRLRDPQSTVRQAAAISLVRLQASEAVPALMEAARGAKANNASNLPAALRSTNQDVNELLLLANCIRVLKGENSPFAVQTLPNKRTLAWPEYDREIFRNQLDLLKSYKVIEVMGSATNPSSVVIQDPNGQENLYKLNEQVAAGFEVREFSPAGRSENGQPVPAWCTLYRGDTRVVLVAGRDTEIEVGPHTKKEMKMKDDKVDNREGTPDKPFLRH